MKKRSGAVRAGYLAAALLLVSVPCRNMSASSGTRTVSGSTSAQKEESTGDFIVSGGEYGTDYAYRDGNLTIMTDTRLTLSGNVKEGGIVLEKEADAEIVLSGLTISSGQCALEIQGGENEIILEGSSRLTSGAGNAGILVPADATLRISGEDDSELYVRGGVQGAGIGGVGKEDYGRIILSGGRLQASGGREGAGIGAGSGKGSGTVEITGGMVKASGGVNAPDLGGGSEALTTLNGDAVLEAEETEGELETEKGMLRQKDTWTVYGDVVLPEDISLPSGNTMKISEKASLTIPQELSVRNLGEIAVYGDLEIMGELDNERGHIWLYETGSIQKESNITGKEPETVKSDEILLSQGAVVIEEEGYRQNGTLTEHAGNTYTLRGEGENAATVTVKAGVTAELTLRDVQIRAEENSPALLIGENASVILYIDGQNTLEAERLAETVEMEDGADVEIQGEGSLLLQGRGDGKKIRLTEENGRAPEADMEETEDMAQEDTEEEGNEDKTDQSPEEVRITVSNGNSISESRIPEAKQEYMLFAALKADGEKDQSVTLSRSVLRRLIEDSAGFYLETDALSIEMDTGALKALLHATKSDINIRIYPFSLNSAGFEQAEAVVGNRPVYDIQISEDVNGKPVVRNVDFSEGRVTITIPYDKKSDEDISLIYVGTGNQITWLDSDYHEETGSISADVPHFSVYAVASGQNKTTGTEGWRTEADGNTYYFYEDGTKAVNTVIDGFRVDDAGRRMEE